MGREPSNKQTKVVVALVTASVILSIFNVIIWRSVLREPADASAHVAEEEALGQGDLAAEGSSDADDAPVRVGDASAQGSHLPAAADAAVEHPTSETDGVTEAPPPSPHTGSVDVASPAGTVSGAVAARAVHENTGAPVRIKIPHIAVDAAIEQVTLADDGSMDVPTLPRDAAWYALGPRPGETGTAVIAGHVDGPGGAPAVFAKLHRLRPGDKIAVQDDSGAVTYFAVRESRRYEASTDALEIFSSNDGGAHLNIITCDGIWDELAGQYSERLVVFTDRLAEQ